jgi:light-regulated signal transduction histidine kinase (bacteriophytochrome)
MPGKQARVAALVRGYPQNGVGFDPVYTDPSSSSMAPDEYGGTGLGTGLATVRRIVERHGGQTWAEGAVDGGATFYLTLGEKDTSVSGEASLLVQDVQDGGAHPELSGAA